MGEKNVKDSSKRPNIETVADPGGKRNQGDLVIREIVEENFHKLCPSVM